jgi:hypothetical protein
MMGDFDKKKFFSLYAPKTGGKPVYFLWTEYSLRRYKKMAINTV